MRTSLLFFEFTLASFVVQLIKPLTGFFTKLLAVFVFILALVEVLPAQTITLQTNPDNNYGFSNYSIVYNGNLYFQYRNASNKYQLAKYDGSSITLISNPDGGYGFNGYPIVYGSNLYFQYENASSNYQLAKYDGTSLTLISNFNPNEGGFIGYPTVYSGSLYFPYSSTAGKVRLAKYNGTTLSLITAPDASNFGISGSESPIEYAGNLYFSYRNISSKTVLAKYDGASITLITNPDAGNISGTYITYSNALYCTYNNAAGKKQLAKYNGTSLTLIDNPTTTGNMRNYPTVYNGNLYCIYAATSSLFQWAKYNGSTVSLISNPDAGTGVYSTPIVYNGSLYSVYYNASSKFQFAKYDGSTHSLINNPDGGSGIGAGYAPIEYGGSLYTFYINTANKYQLCKCDGSSLSLINNLQTTDGGIFPPLTICNNNLYVRYVTTTGAKLGRYSVVWKGTSGTSWATASNWESNAVPVAADHVAIPATGVTNEPTLPSAVSIRGLSVASNRTLTLNANLAVTDSAVFESNEAGTARIGNSSGSIVGKVIAKKYIAGGKRGWRFMAHPFTMASAIKLSQYADDVDITGPGGTTKGFANNTNTAYGAYYYDFDLGNPNFANDPGWRGYDSTNMTINSGIGFRIFVRGSKGQSSIFQSPYPTPEAATVSLSGNLNLSGNYQKSLAKNGNTTGYNFVGNPYLSAIDATAVTRTADVNTNIWVWNPRMGTAGGYLTCTANSGYAVPALGSFIVQVSATGQSITFTEAIKTTADTSTMLRQTAQKDMLEMTVNADGNMFDRFTMFFNKKGSTAGTDAIYDAAKFRNAEANLYSLNNDQKALAVDMRPYNNDAIIPLGFTSNKSKTYTLKVENLNLDGSENYLFLTDKYLDTQIKLEPGTEYEFTVDANTASQGDNRFELSYKPRPIRRANLDIVAYPNPATHSINIKMEGLKEQQSTFINIINAEGKVVKTIAAGKRSVINSTINVQSLTNGLYIVELINGTTKKTTIIIKN